VLLRIDLPDLVDLRCRVPGTREVPLIQALLRKQADVSDGPVQATHAHGLVDKRIAYGDLVWISATQSRIEWKFVATDAGNQFINSA